MSQGCYPGGVMDVRNLEGSGSPEIRDDAVASAPAEYSKQEEGRTTHIF
jgi:hypothetical protein